MIAAPLKNKLIEIDYNKVASKEDIFLAVEWLKERQLCFMDDLKIKTFEQNVMIEIINQAFEDVL